MSDTANLSSLPDDTVEARQRGLQFSPADSRSLEMAFCCHLLLPAGNVQGKSFPTAQMAQKWPIPSACQRTSFLDGVTYTDNP